jgi:hypothetical protein
VTELDELLELDELPVPVVEALELLEALDDVLMLDDDDPVPVAAMLPEPLDPLQAASPKDTSARPGRSGYR